MVLLSALSHDHSMPDTKKIPLKSSDNYRILHTADWHLGKTLNDQSREEEHRLFLDWLLESIEEHKVDAVLLAGDVFDSSNPPQSALSLYYNFVAELFIKGNRTLAVIAGNHDSAALLEAPKQALKALHVHVVGSMPESPADRILHLPSVVAPKVAIAMLPFLRDRDLRTGRAGETREEIRRELAEGIRQRYVEAAEALAGDLPAIAAGHLTVTGSSTSDSEREIHIGGLGAVGAESFPKEFAYVALGHLHRPQQCGSADHVRYSGSPIALSFSEATDKKEIRILDISDRSITHQGIPIPTFRELKQIRTKTASLEKDLKNHKPDQGKLKPWVEVVVEDATLQDDLNDQVRRLCEKAPFDVLKVIRGKNQAIIGPGLGDHADFDDAEDILSDPKGIFERLLEQHAQLTPEDKELLRTSFAALHEKALAL